MKNTLTYTLTFLFCFFITLLVMMVIIIAYQDYAMMKDCRKAGYDNFKFEDDVPECYHYTREQRILVDSDD